MAAGVTYERVAAAADALVADGKTAGWRSIRHRLGTGSASTITQHLVMWRARNPRKFELPELTGASLRGLQVEFQRQVAAAREDLEKQLEEALADVKGLADIGQELEQERDALKEREAALTRDRDTLGGQVAELTKEVERLTQELERERQAAEAARGQEAQARLASRDLEQTRSSLNKEREARIQAQRDHQIVIVEKTALGERVADLQGREQVAITERKGLQTEFQALTTRLQEVETQRALAQGEAAGAKAGLAQLSEELNQRRSELAHAHDQMAQALRAASEASAAREGAETRIRALESQLTAARSNR